MLQQPDAMNDKNEQQILCLPAPVVEEVTLNHGYWHDARALLDTIEKHHSWERRGDVEDDPRFKQVVTQVLLTNGPKLCLHQIPATGSEARLHHQFPIFFGGHVDQNDLNPVRHRAVTQVIAEATYREIAEEIGDAYPAPKWKLAFAVGAINMNDLPVNRCHVGIVSVMLGVDDQLVESDTTDEGVHRMHFVPWSLLETVEITLTPWSRVAYRRLRQVYDWTLPRGAGK